jgi:hypothetical protein
VRLLSHSVVGEVEKARFVAHIVAADVRQRLEACDIKLVFDLRESDYMRVERELNSLRNCYRSRKHYLEDGLADYAGFS